MVVERTKGGEAELIVTTASGQFVVPEVDDSRKVEFLEVTRAADGIALLVDELDPGTCDVFVVELKATLRETSFSDAHEQIRWSFVRAELVAAFLNLSVRSRSAWIATRNNRLGNGTSGTIRPTRELIDWVNGRVTLDADLGHAALAIIDLDDTGRGALRLTA